MFSIRSKGIFVEVFSNAKYVDTRFVKINEYIDKTSGYATWFTAGGAIRIAHYDVIDDVITRKL